MKTIRGRMSKHWVIFLAVGLSILLAAFFAYTAVADQHFPAANYTCIIDVDGPNDQTDQKDLTQMCADVTGDPIFILFNWDEILGDGNNTYDGCSLFDTDDDGNANYSMCVSVIANGATDVMEYNGSTLWSCGDDKSDRCTENNDPVPFNGVCTAYQDSTDPFPAGAEWPEDTVGECEIPLGDMSGLPKFLNTCSFPSGQPNSSPSDCVALPDSGFITIEKVATDCTDTSFQFAINDGSTDVYTPSIACSGIDGPFNVPAGTYSVTESVPEGWQLDDAYCWDNGNPVGTFSGNAVTGITVGSGDSITCTFNDSLQKAKLTVVKDPTNNSGGTALPDDFLLTVNSEPVLSDEKNEYNANTNLVLGETLVAGYEYVRIDDDGSGRCPSALDTNFQLQPGDDVTCTIVNNDTAPKLTVVKDPTNNSGGTALPDDFLLTVNSEPVLSDEKNEYIANTNLVLGETLVAGYEYVRIDDDGSGRCPSALDTNFQLQPGDDVTCTIVNNDTAPKLTVVKDPTNNSGGTALPDDFLLTVNSEPVLSDEENEYIANTNLVLGETLVAGYEYVRIDDDGSGRCPSALDTNFQLQPGDDVTCTIVNNDTAPKLTVVKDPTNNSGGTALPDDFLLTVNSEPVLSDEKNEYIANTNLVLGETLVAGYEYVRIDDDGSGRCPSALDTNFQLQPGDDVTCTIVNNDTAPKLTVVKDPTNNSGGTALPDDFLLTVNSEPVLSDEENEYIANTNLVLGETLVAGYEYVRIDDDGSGRCPSALDTNFQLQPGDDVTCTIVNNDTAPKLTVVKDPTNNSGGTALPDDFLLTVNSEPVLSDEENEYIANTNLVLGETLVAGYEYVRIDDDGSGRCPSALDTNFQLQPGDDVTCTIVNDDIDYKPVIKIVKTGPTTAKVGDNVTYNFEVTNDDLIGDGSPIDNVSVTDTIAGTATYVSGDTGADGILEVGETWIFTANYIILTSDPNPLVNTGTANGKDLNGDPVSDNDDHSLNVEYWTDLSITKEGPIDPVVVNSQFNFYITVHNAGPSPAVNVVVTDTVPSDLSYVTAFPIPDVFPTPIVWNLGTMAPGQTEEITLTVYVQPWAQKDTINYVTNYVQTTTETKESDYTNNEDEATVEVPPRPTAVTMTDGPSLVADGDQITINWQTGAEPNVYGFNIYRSNVNDFSTAENIHSEDPQGDVNIGATYSYTETPPSWDDSWYYWLTVVSHTGEGDPYGPLTAEENYFIFLPAIFR